MWLRIFNGHLRIIHCFKGVSKTKLLRVKDKQSETFRSLFCLSGEITAFIFRIRPHANLYATNGAPRRFCMRHLDSLGENVAKSRPRQNTETVTVIVFYLIEFLLCALTFRHTL